MVPSKAQLSLILHNIRSAHNVGSIFRTADGAGAARIYLCGHTPTPIDRFGREQPDIAKVALGAHETIPWEHHADSETLIHSLKEKGVTIVAVEQHADAVDYRTFTPKGDVAVIVGNEIEGVPDALCAYADTILAIPMCGIKESLNVSVATGIVLYRFLDEKTIISSTQ